ncbi:hypothetical protein ABL839_28285 [Variovorax atrisoli 110B]|nr:hypothetical protein [Variovorax paradoxus]
MLQALHRALLLSQVACDAIEAFDNKHVEAVSQGICQQGLAASA